MPHFVGFDLHRNRSHVCVVDDGGELVASEGIVNDPRRVLRALAGWDDPRVAVEATYGWEWLVELLEDHGISHALSHPARTRAIATARVKTDAIDAQTLAQLHRTGFLPESYIASRDIRDLRGVIRHRVALTQARTSMKNRVRALVAALGCHPTHTDLFGPAGQAELQAMGFRPDQRERIQSLLRVITMLTTEITIAKNLITAHADQHRDQVEVLTLIPGVGVFTAMVIIAEVADITRFPTPKHLVSYAGLAPVVRNSDRTTRIGHISRHGPPILRWALVQAAHVAIRKPGPLHDTHQRIRARRGANIATVAVAARILKLAYHGLRDGEIRCLNQPTPTT